MLKKFLTSKVFLILILIGLSFLTYRLVKITKHKFELKSELEPLNKEITQIKQEKKELSENFEYFKTQSYAEKEARAKLNLKKEGEEVVIVSPGEEGLGEANLNPNLEELALSREEDTPLKKPSEKDGKTASKMSVWWNYFFGN